MTEHVPVYVEKRMGFGRLIISAPDKQLALRLIDDVQRDHRLGDVARSALVDVLARYALQVRMHVPQLAADIQGNAAYVDDAERFAAIARFIEIDMQLVSDLRLTPLKQKIDDGLTRPVVGMGTPPSTADEAA